jgi:hypothetical protein
MVVCLTKLTMEYVMGQTKRQYQEWLEHHYPQEVAQQVKAELNDEWVKQFEQVLKQLLNGRSELGEDKHE